MQLIRKQDVASEFWIFSILRQNIEGVRYIKYLLDMFEGISISRSRHIMQGKSRGETGPDTSLSGNRNYVRKIRAVYTKPPTYFRPTSQRCTTQPGPTVATNN
jgi:hypothetical protein